MIASLRKSSLPILLISAMLLAVPALAQPKIDPADIEAAKYANGGGLPNDLTGPVPPNDDCDAAEALAVPGTAFGTTIGANFDPEAGATCGTAITAEGVWYTVIGNGNTFTASTCDGATDYDTKLSVFCEDCADLTCVDGNDDGGSQNPQFCSEIAFCTQIGAEYSVLVHGFGADTGNFELTMTDDGVPCGGAVSCLPVGACCDDMLGCAEVTEAECAASGGTYLGDGVACNILDPAVTYSDTPGTAIPDNDPAGITAVINVPDSLIIADVNVDLTITHTFIDDLFVTLTHPDGAPTVTLWDRACGSEDDINVTFDDQGGALVCASPTVGDITPESAAGTPLSAFNGLDSAGDWTLFVSDNVGADTGTLDAWGLEIASGTSACEVLGGGNFDIEIPTLNQVGLAVLALLLAGGAIFLIRRRA